MAVSHKKKTILFIVVFFWVVFSVFNTLFNTAKSYSEVKEWAYLSDTQKRHKIFGNIYDFCIFLNENTPKDAEILVYSNDVKTYYLCLYYLYPRSLYVADDKKQFNDFVQKKRYKYIATFNSSLILQHYKQIANNKNNKNQWSGYLFKLQ